MSVQVMTGERVAALLRAAGADLGHGYQCVTGAYIAQSHHPQVEVGLPLLITEVRAGVAPQVGAVLANAYPAGHPFTVLWAGEDDTLHLRLATLAEWTNQPLAGPSCSLYAPPLPPFSSISALQEIVAHLRAPDGCPWDRAQTLSSLRHDLLSECAEVVEAIDAETHGADNRDQIAEELGDLIMGAVLMVQIATDEGRFQMADAMHSVVTKLRRRHPHVFADLAVDGVEGVLTNWDAIKAQEKAAKGLVPGHPLDGVPAALPALEKARQVQAKGAKAGLLDRAAIAQANPALAAIFAAGMDEGALGELLWQVVALAHASGLNAEDALRSHIIAVRAAHADTAPASESAESKGDNRIAGLPGAT